MRCDLNSDWGTHSGPDLIMQHVELGPAAAAAAQR